MLLSDNGEKEGGILVKKVINLGKVCGEYIFGVDVLIYMNLIVADQCPYCNSYRRSYQKDEYGGETLYRIVCSECGRDSDGLISAWDKIPPDMYMLSPTRIEPCSCCGAEAKLRFQLESDQKTGYWVECVDCGLRTDGGYIAEFEVQRWNQRVNEMEDCTMNAKQAKKMRHNEKLEYIAAFEKWLAQEPPKWKIWAWKRWKSERPHE